ncbi:13638_t:CDS:2, partial [Racocetra persica]
VALFMTSGPADARFLTPEERKFALDRLRPEGGPAPVDRQTAKTQIKLAFQDLKVYAFLILLFLGSIPFNALNLFLPTLIKQLGFSSVDAQLMSVPPLLIATVWMTINSWASDRYETRAWSILASHSLSIIGLVGVMVTSPELYTFRYFCMVLLASGAYSVLPILFSWFACNIAILSLANAGGVIASVIYPEIDAPLFVNGNIVCLVSVLLQCLITIGLKVSLDIINKQRDLATLAAKNYKIDNELMKNKTKLSEVAKKLVENEPRFDEI